MSVSTLDPALERATQALSALGADTICRRTGAEPSPSGVSIRYFAGDYVVSLAPGSVGTVDPGDLRPEERLLVLHYLACHGSSEDGGHAKNEQPPDDVAPNDYVSYESLPGGMFYNTTFGKRGPLRLVHAFGSRPERLLSAVRAVGGAEADYGDVSVQIPVFPRVTVLVVLHRGDDEFPPECHLLFTASVSHYLTLEDIAVLGGIVAGRLIRGLAQEA